ncbi:MAG: hypothetical protein Q9220_000753, partial [cf. Caloplaca sp. 1 TL-2023]
AYISAVTDPKTVSIVGPVNVLKQIESYAHDQGLHFQALHIRGKVHNPENESLATSLKRLCAANPSLQFPMTADIKAPLRSNISGDVFNSQNLTNEAIQAILVSRCEWYQLLNHVAHDLEKTGSSSHILVHFGSGDCLSPVPFHQRELSITKVNAMSLIKDPAGASKSTKDCTYEYPPDSVAVVGIACRFPDATNVEEFWALISSGKSTIQELSQAKLDTQSKFRVSQDKKWASRQKFYGNFIDRPDSFDHSFFGMNPREAVYMDPQQRLLPEASYQAVESSGYLHAHKKEDGDDVGVFTGATIYDYLANTSSHAPTAYTSTGTLGSFLAGRISHHFGWTGPAEVIDTACSSSLVAINRACKAIQHGECSKALVGGVNVITSINNYLDLGKAGFLSPSGQCKPFDKDADGYCRAEGLGLVFLTPLDQALRDNNQILAVISAVATNQGGLSPSITVPHSPTQMSLYRKITQQACIDPHQVSYVEAHGTGTQAGDPLEMASIRAVFGSPQRSTVLHIGSIKGNMGHCEAAAGIAGFIKAVLMIQKGEVPPLASHKNLNPKIPALQRDRLAIATQRQKWDVGFRAICVNSYGAAGSNAAAILCQPPPAKPRQGIPASRYLPFVLSAASLDSLFGQAQDLVNYSRQSGIHLDSADVAFTLAQKRRDHRFRWATTSHDAPKLLRLLNGDHHDIMEVPPKPRALVLVFCGQIGLTVGMSVKLYDAFEIIRSNLDQCDLVVREMGITSLYPAIFLLEPIRDIRLLHCCLFAQQYACAQSWIQSGLKVDALIGQSFGELTALAISGILSLKDALTLVTGRASLIQSHWNSETGAMLSVRCSVDSVHNLIDSAKESGHSIEIACYNASDSFALGGTRKGIDVAEGFLRSKPGVHFRRLDVTHAYHTVLAESILDDLEAIAATLTFNSPTIPLATCTRNGDIAVDSKYVRAHLRDPVYLQLAVQRLEEQYGGCIWLEAGCNSPVFSLVKRAVIATHEHLFQSVSFKDTQDPTEAISQIATDLWREGMPLSHWRFAPPYDKDFRQVWLPPYHFSEYLHWLPYVDHAMEATRQRKDKDTECPTPPPETLLVRLQPRKSDGVERFTLNQHSRRFIELVGGHAVLGRPLCPAGMYLEAAFMAVQLRNPDWRDYSLCFDDCSIESPLGIDPSRELLIELSEKSSSAWSFSYSSSLKDQKIKKPITHCKGRVSLSKGLRIPTSYQETISQCVQRFQRSTEFERLRKDKAYRIFARVVSYSDVFKGISSINFATYEALAQITVPLSPWASETTAIARCDTISLDIFVQVCGLLVNSDQICPLDCAFLAVGIDKICISQSVNLEKCRVWTVHAILRLIEASNIQGDVYIMHPNGEMAATIKGIRFAKVPLATLGRLLDKSNTGTAQGQEVSTKQKDDQVISTGGEDDPIMSSQNQQLAVNSQQAEQTTIASEYDIHSLRKTIASFLGLHSDRILDDTKLEDLGLDSLSSIELMDELSSKYDVKIANMELRELNLHTLSQQLRISTGPIGKVTSAKPSDSMSTALTPGKETRRLIISQVSQHSGCSVTAITDDASLGELGVDSLARIELKADLETDFDTHIDDGNFTSDTRIKDLLAILSTDSEKSLEVIATDTSSSNSKSSPTLLTPGTPSAGEVSHLVVDPVEALSACDQLFDTSADKYGFKNFWDNVAPIYDHVVLTYIVIAFEKLGTDLRRSQVDDILSPFKFSAKHTQLVNRLWTILEQMGYIYQKDERKYRTAQRIPGYLDAQFIDVFTNSEKAYAVDFALMSLTGPRLADCLTGTVDPLKLLFGSRQAQETLRDFYHESPVFLTMTDQLLQLIRLILRGTHPSEVRILEIGAGFGGTTAALVDMLQEIGFSVFYTFTDVAPTLVDKARKNFQGSEWMDFQTLDLEQDPPVELRGKYDFIIATNVVHATANLVASMKRMKTLLKDGGFVCLSEMTKNIDWHNLVFGLLPGWWCFDDGRDYALQSAEAWMVVFKKAGFASCGYSSGTSEEAKTQQLLVASMKAPRKVIKPSFQVRKVVYKSVDGVDIHADIYLPIELVCKAMPIALLFHGGGYMTLSRQAVRPHQIRHLMSKGILPISIDYRLCPEIGIIEGAMADARDALIWVRSQLPRSSRGYGIDIDTSRVAVIGWSTGGHLAMTTAWTSVEAGVDPPSVVLDFYGPTDFEALASDNTLGKDCPARTMPMDQILNSLSPKPITNHNPAPSITLDTPHLGWLVTHDPRSELVFSLFKEAGGIDILVNGLPPFPPEPATRAQLDAISPMKQLQSGKYKVPTFMVHGSEDEICPVDVSIAFGEEMTKTGVEGGVLVVQGRKHGFDADLGPGMDGWEEGVARAYRFLEEKLGL